jgi:hypothetical protein
VVAEVVNDLCEAGLELSVEVTHVGGVYFASPVVRITHCGSGC